MAGQEEDDDLRMALRMSMQHQPPEPKRSKPFDSPAAAVEDSPVESPDAKSRRLQRELMAAAAEKRMLAAKPAAAKLAMPVSATSAGGSISGDVKGKSLGSKDRNLGRKLSEQEVNQLFSMLFGNGVSKDILAQWTNQGIRFSPDHETSMGLVQHEGGPCGVLAAVQAFVLKYLIFFPGELGKCAPNMTQSSGSRRLVAPDDFSVFTEGEKARALVRSMAEILFLCGNNRRAVVATLNVNGDGIEGSADSLSDEIDAKALEGIQIETASDLVKILRVEMYDSRISALQRLEAMIPVYESRMGAMLFLISALLSRGLDSVQADRDDPSQPLVTAPFGHASQEIVNLLLCGEAVPNVFDGRMDLGGGMFLKGISSSVEVGFLTLLESLNFCKVGRNLKCPKWPIWVIGSESHYTVLFALDTTVQDENELEERESKIRRAFDAQDQSGGGGFISVEGFSQVLRDTNVNLPPEKLDHLTSTGFIVWSEFWQVILDLDKSLGGLKDSTVSMGKKLFDLYHFNGIAKSVLNGNQASSGGDTLVQRPRLTKLRVSVPPRWTPEEFMSSSGSKDTEMAKPPEPPQHAPLVDCIRTRWPRALCNWLGDPPSIV